MLDPPEQASCTDSTPVPCGGPLRRERRDDGRRSASPPREQYGCNFCTVRLATRIPSFTSSPRMRSAPQESVLHGKPLDEHDGVSGQPCGALRLRFPSPEEAEPFAVPTQEGLWLHKQHRVSPSIHDPCKDDEQPPLVTRELGRFVVRAATSVVGAAAGSPPAAASGTGSGPSPLRARPPVDASPSARRHRGGALCGSRRHEGVEQGRQTRRRFSRAPPGARPLRLPLVDDLAADGASSTAQLLLPPCRMTPDGQFPDIAGAVTQD
jgi:hypothetical protein